MRRTLSTLGGICLGLLLSQFPEYAQQFEQRLGGAVDELAAIAKEFDRGATAGGMTREEALDRYAVTPDDFIVDRGRSMAASIARYEDLSARLARIQGAGAWERLTLLPDYVDTEIGARALENFEPAVPVTMEGIAYAGAGFLIGYTALSALVATLLLPFRRRPRRPRREAPAPAFEPRPPSRERLDRFVNRRHPL